MAGLAVFGGGGTREKEPSIFNGLLGAVPDAQLGELGPPGQLAGDDVGRPSLHNNPAGHEVAGFVPASPPSSFWTRHQSALF